MKSYAVILTPRAERQLAELYTYIASESGEQRAADFIGRLIAECESLSTFPERGTKRDDIRPNLRIKAYRRRVMIAFSLDLNAAAVAVHSVFYGGQQFETELRELTDNK